MHILPPGVHFCERWFDFSRGYSLNALLRVTRLSAYTRRVNVAAEQELTTLQSTEQSAILHGDRESLIRFLVRQGWSANDIVKNIKGIVARSIP